MGSDFSNKRYLVADERGSIIAMTDASGTATAINTYDEYGIPGASNQGLFQYFGQTWLPELQMYNYKARIYSPAYGRFMQTDPAGYPDGPNWYNYVNADPINRMDPTGEQTYNSNEVAGNLSDEEIGAGKGVDIVGERSFDNMGVTMASITYSVSGRLDSIALSASNTSLKIASNHMLQSISAGIDKYSGSETIKLDQTSLSGTSISSLPKDAQGYSFAQELYLSSGSSPVKVGILPSISIKVETFTVDAVTEGRYFVSPVGEILVNNQSAPVVMFRSIPSVFPIGIGYDYVTVRPTNITPDNTRVRVYFKTIPR